MRLKRVKKVDGEVPEEVQRECSLLKLGLRLASALSIVRSFGPGLSASPL